MISRFMVRQGSSAAVAAIAALCLAALVSGGAQSPPEAALKSLQAGRILADIKTLSSDAFEGRGPGTHGEELTVAFMEKEFRAIGLAPGNPDGSYLAEGAARGHQARSFDAAHAFPATTRRCIPNLKRISWPGPSASSIQRSSITPTWSSSATACKPRNTNGTISRAWMCAEK